ncbi:MAG: endonuclease VII domain-containing protein [Methylococcales bacterium]|nr:endonuclease VII domain-containing protein [Methylococcales bacterium]
MTKTCKKCKLEYPATVEYFGTGQGYKDGLRSICKKCRTQDGRFYYRQRVEKCPTYPRNCLLKQKYGLSIADYDKMKEQQGGYCAICGKHQTELKRHLAVDHNHTTGKIRGLLCDKCNIGIGCIENWATKFSDKIRIYLAQSQK